MSQDGILGTQQTNETLASRVHELEERLKIGTQQLEQAVAEHKRIEEIIERGKRQWEATFDAVTDMIILTAGQGRIIRCNRATTRSLKLSYQDLIGSYINEPFFGNNNGEINTNPKVNGPLVFEVESLDLQFPRLPGWYNISNYPLVQEGISLGVVHIIKDITEHRQAEEALRESREELRRTNDKLEIRVKERTKELSKANQHLQHEVEEREKIQALQAKEKELLAITLFSIRDGVISTDRDGIILLYNKAAQFITAFTQAEVLGRNVNDVLQIMDENSSLTVQDSMSILLGDGQNPNGTRIFTLLNKEGKKLLISTSSAPVKDASGNLVGYVFVFDNITERKRLEEQLSLSQKLESIGQLAAGIAHEINTPMQYVGDNTHFMSDAFRDILLLLSKYDELLQFLAQRGDHGAVVEKLNQERQSLDIDYYVAEVPTAIKQSLDGIERVRKIVLAMKAFSHPSNKDKHAANINQGIETTVTISRNEWKYVAELEADLDPDLPMVFCEIDEINQVILNMIINASHAIQEHTAKGGPKLGRIKIQTRRDGDYALINIQDSGYGIPPANLSRIFDPFFTTKEVGKGTGQGLSLAHNIIVNEHKGSISVESEVGKGTTFNIRLPVNDPEAGKWNDKT